MELRDVMHFVRASLTFVQVSPPAPEIVIITTLVSVQHLDVLEALPLFRQEHVKRKKIAVALNGLVKCWSMSVSIIVQADVSALPEKVRMAW